MKTVTLERFELIKISNPGAEIQTRDGNEVVVIPTYDAHSDTTGEVVMLLDRGNNAPKIKPGDVLTHTKTGVPFNIVDPFKAMLGIRKGPKSD